MHFQKISIPTPWKVNGNSEGMGALKSQKFKRNVWGLTGISRGVGGFKPKNLLWEGYGYFLEQHNSNSVRLPGICLKIPPKQYKGTSIESSALQKQFCCLEIQLTIVKVNIFSEFSILIYSLEDLNKYKF